MDDGFGCAAGNVQPLLHLLHTAYRLLGFTKYLESHQVDSLDDRYPLRFVRRELLHLLHTVSAHPELHWVEAKESPIRNLNVAQAYAKGAKARIRPFRRVPKDSDNAREPFASFAFTFQKTELHFRVLHSNAASLLRTYFPNTPDTYAQGAKVRWHRIG